ncbi:MAG: hypothetical protein AWU57_572 [Marinobacter sp. T13-3]|nr:MAG: hypothetical protein AWU57_572 [Marinobacter sp. T13-3]
MIAAAAMTLNADPTVADQATNQHHYDSAEVSAKSVIFLTDINGTNTDQVPVDMLKRMGLDAGIEDGEWFPLTAEEHTYVGRETITLALGSGEHVQAHMGYSALLDNRKYLAPTIEIPFDNRFTHQGTRSYLNARECLKQSQALLEQVCRITGGYFATTQIRLDDSNRFNDRRAHGCFSCTLLIPLAYAKAHAVTFVSWTRHLASLSYRLHTAEQWVPAAAATPDNTH